MAHLNLRPASARNAWRQGAIDAMAVLDEAYTSHINATHDNGSDPETCERCKEFERREAALLDEVSSL